MEIPEQNWLTLAFVNRPFLKFVSKQEKSKNVYNPNTSIGMFSVAGGEKTLLYGGYFYTGSLKFIKYYMEMA